MNKLFIILACMALLAFAEGAFCGTPELVKLLESREFWSSYPWDRYEDSAMYRSTSWRLTGMTGSGDVKTSDDFAAPFTAALSHRRGRRGHPLIQDNLHSLSSSLSHVNGRPLRDSAR